ncbi:MAG: helix-turn-helix transcriptional regulator [Clostridia bacterium]|nr:helix-turn-helix transcriptional regulator [Clostridia bacterium]
MTDILQPTMSSYDADNVFTSPYLKTAKRIADMYCTTIERLCSYDIWFNVEDVLDMLIKFIKRAEGVYYIDEVQERVFLEIDKRTSITENNVYEILCDDFRRVIKEFFRELERIYYIEEDEEITKIFTANYKYLMSVCPVSYRKVSEVCKIGIGTLTRLKQGAEPNVSVLVRLADFFGVTISQLITPNPEFDLVKIVGESYTKTKLTDKEDPVPESEIRNLTTRRVNYMEKDKAKDFAMKYINQIRMIGS